MKKLVKIFLVSFLLFSCSSELDFDQAEKLVLKPVVVANLATFSFEENDFLLNGVERDLIQDDTNFILFNDQEFSNTITKIDLYFEYENNIQREFLVELHFVDSNGARLSTIPKTIPAYNPSTTSKPLITNSVTFDKTNFDILTNTKTLVTEITLQPDLGLPLSSSSTKTIAMKSNATL